MAEELKHLIDQIQKEGVEKAEEEAKAIISQAKEKAAKLVAEAEAKAEAAKKKAEAEAEAFAARSVQTLKQAARDLLITVGQGCEKVVLEILNQEVKAAATGKLLEKMILSVVENADTDLEITVSDSDKAALSAYCVKLAKKSKKAIELKSDSEVLNGFKVAFKGSNAYLDFTGDALAEALGSFLRPELAKVVGEVATEKQAKPVAKPSKPAKSVKSKSTSKG